MSTKKRTLIHTIACFAINLLLLLPACYLSLVAWFTKFSGNTPFESLLARSSGVATLVGTMIAIYAWVELVKIQDASVQIKLVAPLYLSAACTLPFLLYVVFKILQYGG